MDKAEQLQQSHQHAKGQNSSHPAKYKRKTSFRENSSAKHSIITAPTGVSVSSAANTAANSNSSTGAGTNVTANGDKVSSHSLQNGLSLPSTKTATSSVGASSSVQSKNLHRRKSLTKQHNVKLPLSSSNVGSQPLNSSQVAAEVQKIKSSSLINGDEIMNKCKTQKNESSKAAGLEDFTSLHLAQINHRGCDANLLSAKGQKKHPKPTDSLSIASGSSSLAPSGQVHRNAAALLSQDFGKIESTYRAGVTPDMLHASMVIGSSEGSSTACYSEILKNHNSMYNQHAILTTEQDGSAHKQSGQPCSLNNGAANSSIYSTFQTGSEKHLKRQGTMPLSSGTGASNGQKGVIQSQDRSMIEQSRAANATQVSTLHGNQFKQSTSGGDKNGSFLPDIYMTTAGNGKVTVVSSNKQQSQAEAAKRLIKKTKQFILIEDSQGNQKAYKRVSEGACDETATYFNFKEVPSKNGAAVQNGAQEHSDEPFLFKSPAGYSQLMRQQKTTPKTKTMTDQKGKPGSNHKVDKTNSRSPPQNPTDSYYNMIISPKQASSICLNPSNQVGSPMLQSQIYLHSITQSKPTLGPSDQTPSTPQMLQSSNQPLNGQIQPSSIIMTTGKMITSKMSSNFDAVNGQVSAYQSPQVKPSKQTRKVSFEDSSNHDPNSQHMPQFQSKDSFSLTTQIVSKMQQQQNAGSYQLVNRGGNPNAADDAVPAKQKLPSSSINYFVPQQEEAKRSSVGAQQQPGPKAEIIKARAPKSGQKSMKLVYKQMRESSEKTKSVGQPFSSMDDQMSNWVVSDGLQFSVVSVKAEEMAISRIRADINYDQFIPPKTDRVYEFQSKRVEFRRRPSHKAHQVVVVHFDGVIGEIMQKNLGDENYQIALRHGSIEGLQELSKSFQLVLFSMLNEKYCSHIIDLLDKEEVVFDAFYQRLIAFKRTDEYCNYNQVYLDFEISTASGSEGGVLNDSDDQNQDSNINCKNGDASGSLDQMTSVQNSVMVVAPLFLENEDIKDREGEQLLYQEKIFSSMQSKRNLHFKGLPIDSISKEQPPIMFLVPHVRSQVGNLSVSMINISNIIQSLLVTACIVREEQLKELRTETSKDNDSHFRALREEERIKQQLQLQMSANSRSPSPKRSGSSQVKTQNTIQQKGGGLFMMTITTISPKNQFKKILASTKDKVLDQKSCNWMQAFYQIKKYKLFSLKTASSVKFIPEYINKRREEELLKLKQTVFKLKALLKSHTDKQQPSATTTPQITLTQDMAAKVQLATNELTQYNEWAKQSVQQYKNDYYKNLIQLLQSHQQTSLQELIKELEERIEELEAYQQFYSFGEQLVDDDKETPLMLYRFFILQGHQFQNYPLETKAIIKERDTNLRRNLFNWVVAPSSRNTTGKRAASNPLHLLNGQQAHALQHQHTFQQQSDATHQFQPGYRIFSEHYQ